MKFTIKLPDNGDKIYACTLTQCKIIIFAKHRDYLDYPVLNGAIKMSNNHDYPIGAQYNNWDANCFKEISKEKYKQIMRDGSYNIEDL